MFVLVKISDVVQIEPWQFTQLSGDAIADALHGKYANKVLQNVGLVVCLWDVQRSSEGLVSQSAGTGRVAVSVEFRLVVFRPFKGEIVQAAILQSSAAGIRLNMGFFADVWIPAESLFEGSRFSVRDDVSVWIWEQDDKEFFYDAGEIVRFRVEEELWNDHAPARPPGGIVGDGDDDDDDGSLVEEGKADANGANAVSYAVDANGKKVGIKDVPYTIVGSMDTAALGPVLWWNEDAEEDDDMEIEQ